MLSNFNVTANTARALPNGNSTCFDVPSAGAQLGLAEQCSGTPQIPRPRSSPPSHSTATPASATKPSQSQTTHSQADQVIPVLTDSFERFFTIMLRSSVQDYIQAARTNDKSLDLWRVLCRRANLAVPTRRIIPLYDTNQAQQHFDIRAALVLEESREALSRGLASIETKREMLARALTTSPHAKKEYLPRIVTLDVTIATKPNPRHLGITFLTLQCAPYDNGTKQRFTDEQKQHLMPGVVFECRVDESTTLLGCVLPCQPERIHKTANFDLLVFEQLPTSAKKDQWWTLTPVDAMIGPCRQFEACTRGSNYFPMLQAILGHQQSVTAVENNKVYNVANTSQSAIGSKSTPDPRMFEPVFQVPQLNENQEKAVTGFLESSNDSISIVQGPPGTGKTSLLVATICRFLTPNNKSCKERRRLIVCAPTNKAVSVLANRFLSASSDSYECTVNMILVGDDDKLLESKDNCPLRPHFVYSWHKEVTKGFGLIKDFFDPKNDSRRHFSRNDIATKAIGLKRRVIHGLPTLPDNVKNQVIELCDAVVERKLGSKSLFHLATKMYNTIDKLEKDAIEIDIMGSADVIFCTLCSSASRVMRLAGLFTTFGALIVDEAAAATEPDLLIPFHLKPSRVLLVGDPKQLPSTVLSERAKRFGLAISLQERLMSNHCRYEYTMLNVQYRMHPAISAFPSRQFYDGKICDGPNVTLPAYGGRTRLLDGRHYAFVQVDGVESKGHADSTCNHMEAAVVLNLVKQLSNSNSQSWSSTERVRIITFYTAQVTLLRKTLSENGFENVLVATVDSSQGCEADVVIVSLVRSNTAGFLTDDRRVNVALTRARHQLVCVGNIVRFPSMTSAPTLHRLAADARDRDVIVDLNSVGRATKKDKTELPVTTS